MDYVAVRVVLGSEPLAGFKGNTPRSTRILSRGAGSSNLYYADLWIMPTIGSERALAAAIAGVGVGIIRLISQRMVSFLPIEGRLSCRLICHELEFRVRFRPDLALSHRFTSRQQRNRQSLSAVRDVPARLDYADLIAAVTATKARSPTLVGIIWKSA
jgi:hypothetical protein